MQTTSAMLRRWLAASGLALLAGLGACTRDAGQDAARVAIPDAQEVTWGELVPEGATPVDYAALVASPFENTDLAAIQPVSLEVNAALHGRTVKIPGFIVPLEYDATQRVVEFLLVPYFGACIHTPPPPANQIVHVTAAAFDVASFFDPVWVTGELATTLKSSLYGQSAYSMSALRIEPYEEPDEQEPPVR